MRTRFTELVGCEVPVQQAPMSGISGPALVVAAVDAGAMGTVGLTAHPTGAVIDILDGLAKRTAGPVGANFLVPFIEDDAVVSEAAERVRVVDLYHGDPRPDLVDRIHRAGALALWQVGSVAEARAAVDAGVDLLAVRGTEGGGRMHGDRSLWPLLCEVLDEVGEEVPVLAAGGIGTGRGLAAAIAAGADGVRIGTVLAAAAESNAHATYKEALVDASAAESTLTDAFSHDWPGGPHPARVLRRSLDAATATSDEVIAKVMLGGQLMDVPRWSPMAPIADAEGRISAMPMYAGESVAFVDQVEPAGEIIRRIVDDATARLAAVASR